MTLSFSIITSIRAANGENSGFDCLPLSVCYYSNWFRFDSVKAFKMGCFFAGLCGELASLPF